MAHLGDAVALSALREAEALARDRALLMSGIETMSMPNLRPGVGVLRRSGFRGSGSGGGSGDNLPPALFEYPSGTLARTTEASMWNATTRTLGWFGVDELRDGTDLAIVAPNGRPYFMIEGSRTNLVLHSEDMSQAAWSKTGISVALGGTAPDGGSDAYRFDINAAGDDIHQLIAAAGITDNVLHYGTWFVDLVSGHTSIRQYIRDQAGNLGFTDHTISAGWKRYGMSRNSAAGAQAMTANLNAAVATARTVGIWGAQLEEAAYPSSYIRTGAASVTRGADDLTFLTAPASLNDPWTIYVKLTCTSTQLPIGAIQTIFATNAASADRIVIRNDGGTRKVSVYAGGALKVERALTWTAEQELTLTLDPDAGSVTIAGAATGDGTTTTSTWTWDTASELRVGAYIDGSNPLFAYLSEPVAAE